jgi:hypothetical protein
MKSPLPSIFVILLLATALAGCLGDDDVDFTDPDASEDDGETGIVSGRILTIDLDEVVGARVQLVKDQELVKETETDATGAYEIRGVEPGQYRLQVSAPCCRENVRAIQVQAGETIQADLQLERFTQADLQQAYMEPFEWNGFLACGAGSPLLTTAPCGAGGADPNDDFLHEWELHEGVVDVVVGMRWDSAGGVLGERLFIAAENRGCSATECDQSYAREEGASPVIFRLDNPTGEFRFSNIEDEPREMQFRVFPAFEPDVYYQQPFTVHYHVFYHERAPEDYNPIPDL